MKAKKMDPIARGRQIRDAVTEGYLETGKSLDVTDIAVRLGWSVSKVRRVLDECHGSPAGVHPHRDHRESGSGALSGGHVVWVYAPALWHMRDLLLATRGGAP